MNEVRRLTRQGLYDPRFEHDACGEAFVANIKGLKSHAIVQQGLQVLQNLTHRGACGCDPLTGDGAGILMQVPHEFLRQECGTLHIDLPDAGDYGVGIVFLPREVSERNVCEEIFEKVVREEGERLLGWRRVPTDPNRCGDLARKVMPEIRQIFIARGTRSGNGEALERKLYVIRKRVEHAVRAANLRDAE